MDARVEQPLRVSLVLPAHNDATTVAAIVRQATAVMPALAAEYEIIVVDDSSTDGSAQATRDAAAHDPHVRFLQLPHRGGYGDALAAGVAASRFEIVATADAGGPCDAGELKELLDHVRRHDLVCGVRQQRHESLLAACGTWAFDSLTRLLLGRVAHDPHCGLKAFRRTAWTTMAPQDRGDFLHTELPARARQHGLSVWEVAVGQRADGLACRRRLALRSLLASFAALLRFWWNEVQFPATNNAVERPGAPLLCNNHLLDRLQTCPTLLGGLLALVAGLLLFANLDYPLFEPDEGRYAEIGREMLARNDLVVPTLHNEPYLDKPPLFYWLIAGSFHLFGYQDWTARLTPATAAWLTVLLTYVFGCRTLGARPAFLAGLVLSLSMGFAPAGRFLILDSVLTLWVCLSLWTALEAIRGGRFSWHWWLVSATACGLGAMTKGPVALVLLAPVVVGYAWLGGQSVRPRLVHWLAYLATIALVTLPWFVAMVLRVPGFIEEFVWKNHIHRFAGGLIHDQPFWFYLPVLLLIGAPWSFLFLPYLRFQFTRQPATAAMRPRISGFYLLWAAWCLAFFSAASCKLPTYILPALPALALLMGVYLERAALAASRATLLDRLQRRAPRSALIVLSVAAFGVVWAAWFLDMQSLTESLIESTICLAVFGGMIKLGDRLSPALSWALCCLAAFAVTFESARQLVPAVAQIRSPLPESEEVTTLLRDQGTAVVVCFKQWASVPFYLRRDDVHRFDGRNPRLLENLMQQRRRLVLVLKKGESLEELGEALPINIESSIVGHAGRASFWLIEPWQPSPASRTAAELKSGESATRRR